MSPEPRKEPVEPQLGCPNPASHGENTVNPFHSGTPPNLCQLVPTVRRNSGESGFVFYKGMLRGKRQSLPRHASSRSVFTGRANKKVHVERDSWLGTDACRSTTRRVTATVVKNCNWCWHWKKCRAIFLYLYDFYFFFYTVLTASNAGSVLFNS